MTTTTTTPASASLKDFWAHVPPDQRAAHMARARAAITSTIKICALHDCAHHHGFAPGFFSGQLTARFCCPAHRSLNHWRQHHP